MALDALENALGDNCNKLSSASVFGFAKIMQQFVNKCGYAAAASCSEHGQFSNTGGCTNSKGEGSLPYEVSVPLCDVYEVSVPLCAHTRHTCGNKNNLASAP